MIPDLVYPLKVTDDCEELRYSLRSVRAHAAGLFGRVWIITQDALPDWLTGCPVIRAGAPGGKQADVRAKIHAATVHPDVSATFVLMCDDFFLTEPIAQWEPFHMGPTTEYVARLRAQPGTSPGWLSCVTETADWMAQQGHGDVLARQGHRPLLWDRRRLRAALEAYPTDRRLDVNGLYDLAGAAGEGRRACNSKVKNTPEAFFERLAELDQPWLSSNDASFATGMIGGYIRGMFRDPCRYEKKPEV